MSRRALTLGCLAALLAASPAAGAAPKVEQLVVFRDGDAVARTVSAKQLRGRRGNRARGAGTEQGRPARPARLRLLLLARA
jgi:hypothetical protein